MALALMRHVWVKQRQKGQDAVGNVKEGREGAKGMRLSGALSFCRLSPTHIISRAQAWQQGISALIGGAQLGVSREKGLGNTVLWKRQREWEKRAVKQWGRHLKHSCSFWLLSALRWNGNECANVFSSLIPSRRVRCCPQDNVPELLFLFNLERWKTGHNSYRVTLKQGTLEVVGLCSVLLRWDILHLPANHGTWWCVFLHQSSTTTSKSCKFWQLYNCYLKTD